MTLSVFSQDVTYTITGHRQEYESGDTFLLADVHLHSNQGFKLGSGQFYINYNHLAFGENVFSNNNIDLINPDGTIIDFSINAPPFNFSFYNNIIFNDNTSSRVSVSWQHAFSKGCIMENNIQYVADLLFSVKIKYLPGKVNLSHNVCLESSTNFIHQTFTACGPNPCNINDCLNFPGTQLTSEQFSCGDCKFVYTTFDSGSGSLRDAIACSNSGDTVRFAYSLFNHSIILESQTLAIDKDINIAANKNFEISIDGSDIARLFEIEINKNVEITGLKLLEGNGMTATGINNNGNLKLTDVSIFKTPAVNSQSQLVNNGTLEIKGKVEIKED